MVLSPLLTSDVQYMEPMAGWARIQSFRTHQHETCPLPIDFVYIRYTGLMVISNDFSLFHLPVCLSIDEMTLLLEVLLSAVHSKVARYPNDPCHCYIWNALANHTNTYWNREAYHFFGWRQMLKSQIFSVHLWHLLFVAKFEVFAPKVLIYKLKRKIGFLRNSITERGHNVNFWILRYMHYYTHNLGLGM